MLFFFFSYCCIYEFKTAVKIVCERKRKSQGKQTNKPLYKQKRKLPYARISVMVFQTTYLSISFSLSVSVFASLSLSLILIVCVFVYMMWICVRICENVQTVCSTLIRMCTNMFNIRVQFASTTVYTCFVNIIVTRYTQYTCTILLYTLS